MHFVTEVLPIALLAAGQAFAAPVTPNEPAALLARDYQQFKGCSPEQKKKIEEALSDAAVLARFVEQNKDGKNSFATGSTAYQNYFESDEWKTGVQDVYAAVGKQWQAPAPINGEAQPKVAVDQFTVIITCEDPHKVCSSKSSVSLVVTDVSPLTKTFTPTMTICPAFFNDPRTKNNLNSLPYKLNPGRREASWCKFNEKFRYFEAGAAGGLASHPADSEKPDGVQTQGTEDVYGMKGYSADPETAARQLRTNWQKIIDTDPEPPESTWPPFVEKLNAESYAAAALEWWFMQQCEFPNIEGN